MSNNIRIAIAEDHKMMRQSLVEYLNSCDGLQIVLEACNGKDLLHKLKHSKQLPDICLMDISMPEMNGCEATANVEKLFPQVKVLAVTMFEDDFNIIRMLKNGACGYVSKNSDLSELCRAIQVVYKEGFYSSTAITSALKLMMRSNVEKNKELVLNEREISFLGMCCTSLSYKQIAENLAISSHTLINHFIKNIERKINLSTRIEFVQFAARVGINLKEV